MTIDSERLRSINAARDLLDELLWAKQIRLLEMRKKIGRVLRHYPEAHWVEDLGKHLGDKELWQQGKGA